MGTESPKEEEVNVVEMQKKMTEQGLEDAAKRLDGDPALAERMKADLVAMNAGKEISPKQVETLTTSGNYLMAEAAKRELKAVNEKHAEEQGKTPEEYDWYIQKAQEHLARGVETVAQAMDRLEKEGRKFEVHIMSRFL